MATTKPVQQLPAVTALADADVTAIGQGATALRKATLQQLFDYFAGKLPPTRDGVDGRTILNGTAPPVAALGADGDFYIDHTNPAEPVVYGPKAGGNWPLGVSMVGKSAYELAVAHGYAGTEAEWVADVLDNAAAAAAAQTAAEAAQAGAEAARDDAIAAAASVPIIDDAIADTDPGATTKTRSASKIGALISAAVTALGLGSVATHNITEFPLTVPDRATLAAHTATATVYFDGFMWDLKGTNLSTQVASDPNKGIFVAKSTDATGASGAWVRRTYYTHPAMFGTVGDEIADDAPALNAWLAFAAVNRNYKHVAAGLYGVSSGLILDPGTFGVGTLEIDWSNTRITAKAPISRLLTIQDANNGKFTGRLHLRGTGYTSDAYTAWTCDTAVWGNNISAFKFDHWMIEGFGYAAIESEKSSNDSVHWGRIETKRVGSGAALASRSLSANWSGATQSGGYGSVAQYTQFTVDTLPIAYVQSNTANVPDRQILVEINGRPHFVNYIDPATKTLRVYPQVMTALLPAGTLKYHYGGALVCRGTDSNIDTFEQISCVAGGCALELSCLYGIAGGIVHSEACGSNIRIGASPSSVMWGANIGMRYCEGNTFNQVKVTLSATAVVTGPAPATTPAAKDVDTCTPLSNPSGGEAYVAEAYAGITNGADQGWHFRTKRFVLSANEQLDFNQPAMFRGKVFYTNSVVDTATFSLVAPDVNLKAQYAYDAAQVVVVGRGTNGAIAGAVTFTVPTTAYASCTTTNGSAVVTMASTSGLIAGMPITGAGIPASTTISAVNSATQITLSANATASGTVTLTVTNSINGAFANLVYAGGTFSGPTNFAIVNTGPTSWVIFNVPQGGIPAGNITISGSLSSTTNVAVGSIAASAKWLYNSLYGAVLQGKGTTYDVALFNGGASLVMGNPTGTKDARFQGALTSAGGALGYATGAGGTVTQVTSKTTAVTLNKVCGQFTTTADPIAAGATAIFQVNNSNVASTDTILLNLQSGQATMGTYSYRIEKVAAGSFTVTIENRSGGSLSEALVFNFTVFKGVNA